MRARGTSGVVSTLRPAYLLALVLLGGMSFGQGNPAAPQADQPTEATEPQVASDLHSLYYSAHLPTDRRFSQDLQQVKQLIAVGRYSEALPLIDRVLAANEDAFELPRSRNSIDLVQGLKRSARQILMDLPSAGIVALDLDQGVKARRKLQQAIASGSLAQLSAIARRYPMTEAAMEAMLMLAQSEVDAGRWGTAAGIYEQLQGWPKAVQHHQAFLSVRLTWCYAKSCERSNFERSAEQLQAITSPAERTAIFRLIGTEDLSGWVDGLRTQVVQSSGAPASNGWWLDGRDYSRNPMVNVNPLPHVWPAWDARTVKESNVASRLQSRVEWQHRHNAAWGLVASPIAVGNYVIVRTPTNLVAIDWHTGRRIWETRPESIEDDNNTIHLQHKSQDKQSVVALDATDQRLWMDAVYGALSCDGDRVYAIQNLESINMRAQNRFRVQGLFRAGQMAEAPGNTLTAYELRSEGKRIWELNGDNDPSLKGCFFLGPPLAVGRSLFVLAEFANSIHLLELDAATGGLQWKQPLANLERSVLLDVGRRLAGATLTYANGLLLCPTGAGSVVAVDPLDRSLQWVFRFDVDESIANRSNATLRQSFGVYQPNLTTSWQRNRIVASDGVLLVTAPESERLYCIDLLSGEARWSRDREDHHQLIGISENLALLAGGRHLTLVDLHTGELVANEPRIELPDDQTIAGSGLLTGQQVLLPLANNEIGVIDLASRSVSALLTLREGVAVGNLAFHRGSVLSQSATTLTRLDRLDLLKEQLAKASSEDDDDASTLRIAGELAWGEGQLDDAIDLLRRAYDLDPEDVLVRHRLNGALVAAMRADYTRFGRYTGLLEQLCTDTRQRLELYRFSVDGALAAQDPNSAFQFIRDMYAIDREGLIDFGGGHQSQAERWFSERIARIWRTADPMLQEEIRGEVERLFAEASSGTKLSRLVRYYGAIPAGRDARVRLASEWSDAGRLAESELLLLQPDAKERTAQYGLPSANSIAAIAGESAIDYDPHNWLATSQPSYLEWPDGTAKAEITTGQVDTSTPNQAVFSYRARGNQSLRTMVNARSCGVPRAGPDLVAITHGGSPQLVAWNSLGDVTHGIPLQMASLQNSNSGNKLVCIRFGHFAVIGVGDELASIDLRPSSAERGMLLWSSDLDPRMRAQALRMLQLQNRRVAHGQVVLQQTSPASADSRSPSGELCHASPLGVVVRTDDQISCYDPVDGDLLWLRRGVPASGTSFGDSHHLLLVEDGAAEGLVVSMIDGSVIGKWQSPEGNELLTSGSHLLVSQFQAGRRVVRLIDAISGEVLLERTYDSDSKVARYASDFLAVMQSNGELDVIDCHEGRLLFSQTVEPLRGLQSIHPMLAGDLLVLATNTRSAAQHNTTGNRALDNAPVITGKVYALDSASGQPQWPQPATVKGQGLWQLQPSGSPVLVFVSRLQDRKSNKSSGKTRLLCLDKRTGRSLVRNDGLREMQNQPWSMRIDHSQNPMVRIDLRQSLVSIEFTGGSRPPEPVALAEVEGIEKSISAGLLGILRRSLGGALQDPPSQTDDDD